MSLRDEIVSKMGYDPALSGSLDPRVREMRLWAWVGEDELGSGEVGIKQAFVPAGLVPLVACKRDRMAQKLVSDQMSRQAMNCSVTIRLVRFSYEAVEITLKPGN